MNKNLDNNRLLQARPRLRFKEQDDLALLREVLSINPLQDPNLWAMVREHLLIISGKNFTIKTLRDHLLLLIQQWLEKIKDLQDRSGIEESYSEKDHLCHQINEMMGENAKTKRLKKMKTKENLGRIIRDKFAEEAVENDLMENSNENNDHLLDHGYFSVAEVIVEENAIQNELILADNENSACTSASPGNEIEDNVCKRKIGEETSTSPGNKIKDNIRKRKTGEERILQRVRARTRRTNAQKQGLEYLENYDKTQNELKKIEQIQAQQKINIEKEKLVIENRRLDLDEKKFLLDEYERRKSIELLEEKMKDEKRERDLLLQVIERQENVINALLKNK